MDSSQCWTGENSLLDGGPKCQEIWLVLAQVCHGLAEGPVDVKPKNQGLAGVQNAVWMLKKSGPYLGEDVTLVIKVGLH